MTTRLKYFLCLLECATGCVKSVVILNSHVGAIDFHLVENYNHLCQNCESSSTHTYRISKGNRIIIIKIKIKGLLFSSQKLTK